MLGKNDTVAEGAASPRRAEGPSTEGGRAATGIEGLDNILGGGLPRNRLYLVQGYPGTGKTTLALQFLRRGQAQGEPGLYITLAESAEELRATAVSHGWEPDGVEIHEHLPATQLNPETQHTLFHSDEVDLSETVTALLQIIERTQPRRLVLDSLSELQLLAGNPLRYRREVLALKDYFAHRDCTVLLLDDRTMGDGDTQLQSLCHGVLLLEGRPPITGRSGGGCGSPSCAGCGSEAAGMTTRLKRGGCKCIRVSSPPNMRKRPRRGRSRAGFPPWTGCSRAGWTGGRRLS